MKRSLLEPPNYKRKVFKKVTKPLPIKLSKKERRFSLVCPLGGYYVTAFSCLQCNHFEIHENEVRVVTGVPGKCMHPRKASRQSRKITGGWAPFGDLVPREKKGHAPTANGMCAKVEVAVKLMDEGLTRQQTIQKLLQTFPDMSKGYAAAVQYKAKKQREEEA